MLNAIQQDIRYACRTLAKNPGFTAVAVASLALGIGANTTIFTVLNALFLHPLPVEETSTLVNVYTTDDNMAGSGTRQPMSFPNFEDYRDRSDVFAGLAAFGSWPVTLVVGASPERVGAIITTANYFEVLGVRPVIGRTFFPDEDAGGGAHPVAVLSHALWMRLFDGDPDAVGRTVKVNATPLTIIGVAPPGFVGTRTFRGADQVWVTMAMRHEIIPADFRGLYESRRALAVEVFGRLRPDVERRQAEVAFEAIAARLADAYPADNEARGVAMAPLADGALGIDARGGLLAAGALVMTVVGVVLLIACVNLANLIMARSAVRSREMSIRVAMGATRGRIMGQLLTESIVLSMMGGIVGLLVAFWARDVLWAFRPMMVPDDAIVLAVDVRVLGFTVVVALLTGVVFGLVPAFRASSPHLQDALKAGAAGAGGTGGGRLRNLLVVTEVALAVVTLVSAGLFVRSLREALQIDPGFESRNLFVVTMNLGSRRATPQEGGARGGGLESSARRPGAAHHSARRTAGGPEGRRDAVVCQRGHYRVLCHDGHRVDEGTALRRRGSGKRTRGGRRQRGDGGAVLARPGCRRPALPHCR
jgi:predicted permease